MIRHLMQNNSAQQRAFILKNLLEDAQFQNYKNMFLGQRVQVKQLLSFQII